MEILKLLPGEIGSDESDCIQVQQLPNGEFALSGSVLLACGDGEAVESVSLIGGNLYRTYEDAEAAGLAWANEHCVSTLVISRSDGAATLPSIA
jgi:hypothetical protein